ncbi:MAG: hypothetical protein ACI8UP_005064, partial [Porticoccaceae bacterium]
CLLQPLLAALGIQTPAGSGSLERIICNQI